MPIYRTGSAIGDRNFLLFFFSQIFLSCGAFAQLIAVARLLVMHTNSGLATGFGMVCAPLPGVVLSLLAGSLGDKLPVNKLLVFFDIIKGILALTFLFCNCALSVIILMLVSSLFDVLYNPSKNKLLTLILTKDDLLNGNSILTGGYGAVSMLTPVLIGLLIDRYDIRLAFLTDCVLCFLSALLLSGIKIKYNVRQNDGKPGYLSEIRRGFRYCLENDRLKYLILTLSVIDFGIISVNIAFYSLAFDSLKVTNSYWGMLLSLLYGMNLFAMLLLIRYKKGFKRHPFSAVQILLPAISLVWFFYSTTSNQAYLLAGVAAEGLCLSLCNTLLLTGILETAKTSYAARVMGIRDLTSNAAKLAGIGTTYLLMMRFNQNIVFISSAAVILLLAVARMAGRCIKKLS